MWLKIVRGKIMSKFIKFLIKLFKLEPEYNKDINKDSLIPEIVRISSGWKITVKIEDIITNDKVTKIAQDCQRMFDHGKQKPKV